MPQFVSAKHKEIAEILRREYGDKLIAWPDTEVNIGKLAGLKGMYQLRCDYFIWISEVCAVALEYHSEIHTHKQIFDSNIIKIQGRDEAKKSLLSRLGIGLVEIYPDDKIDIKSLKKRIDVAIKDYPEIAFTKHDKDSKINTEIKSNFKLKGTNKWQSRTLISSQKLKSRPFKKI
jgi:hypothetical protein